MARAFRLTLRHTRRRAALRTQCRDRDHLDPEGGGAILRFSQLGFHTPREGASAAPRTVIGETAPAKSFKPWPDVWRSSIVIREAEGLANRRWLAELNPQVTP
jgi:hypothetical protein